MLSGYINCSEVSGRKAFTCRTSLQLGVGAPLPSASPPSWVRASLLCFQAGWIEPRASPPPQHASPVWICCCRARRPLPRLPATISSSAHAGHDDVSFPRQTSLSSSREPAVLFVFCIQLKIERPHNVCWGVSNLPAPLSSASNAS